MNTGERIRRLRERLGINRAYFISRLGITQGYLSKVEAGKANISQHKLIKIIELFGARSDWLLRGTGPMLEADVPYETTPHSPEEISERDPLSLGKRLKAKRKEKHLTQEAFAKPLGISPNYLSEIEKGKKEPSEVILRAIEARYAINYAWLTTGVNTELAESYGNDRHSGLATGLGASAELKAFLKKVEEIMMSEDEAIKTALRVNVNTFHEAVRNKKKVSSLQRQNDTLKKIVHPTDLTTEVKEE